MTARARVALLSFAFLAASLQLMRAENPDHVKQLKETRSCPGCDLADASLQGVVATGGDLTGANLTNAVLYMATFKDADLTGAILTGADLSGAILTGAKGVNLQGAKTDRKTTCPDGTQGPCS